MAVRISGPGSPLERYKGKLVAANGQLDALVQSPIRSFNPSKRMVDVSSPEALSRSYAAAEAAIVRLGRGVGGGGVTPGAGRETLSVRVVSRLLSPDDATILPDSDVVDEGGVSQVAKDGKLVKGEDVASIVAAKLSKDIRDNREKALGLHR